MLLLPSLSFVAVVFVDVIVAVVDVIVDVTVANKYNQ